MRGSGEGERGAGKKLNANSCLRLSLEKWQPTGWMRCTVDGLLGVQEVQAE